MERQEDNHSEESQTDLYIPKPINDPNCEHFLEFVGYDSEGVKQARCTKCPVGFRFEGEIVNGRITT